MTITDDRMSGPADLMVEVANSSRAIDLGTKKRDYERAGVREYVVVLARERSAVWFRRTNDGFVELAPGDDGVFRSASFPGLWLDPRGLFSPSRRKMVSAVRTGLATPEHAAFVAALRKAKTKRATKKRPPKSK